LDQINFSAGQQTESHIGEHDIDFVRDCPDESVKELLAVAVLALSTGLAKAIFEIRSIATKQI
jgi:hypothetical protein